MILNILGLSMLKSEGKISFLHDKSENFKDEDIDSDLMQDHELMNQIAGIAMKSIF